MHYNQFSQQQQPNQATASQSQSDQQSFHLVNETEDEDELVPTPTSKKTKATRLKSEAKKNKETEKQGQNLCSQDKELILAESFIQISDDPRTGCDQKNDTFWYKILDVYNAEATKHGYMERTKNMLTQKWTPMNRDVQKFNSLVQETQVANGENDEDWMTRVEMLFRTHTHRDFKHKSAWLFLKDKHKWKNPESTLARRNRLRVTDKEPEHFGKDALPRLPGA
ncbi:hypothetical protein Tco_0960681 [Tanacetum coccineum]